MKYHFVAKEILKKGKTIKEATVHIWSSLDNNVKDSKEKVRPTIKRVKTKILHLNHPRGNKSERKLYLSSNICREIIDEMVKKKKVGWTRKGPPGDYLWKELGLILVDRKQMKFFFIDFRIYLVKTRLNIVVSLGETFSGIQAEVQALEFCYRRENSNT